MSFTGGCLCGGMRYEIRRKYLNAIHCYCAMCRKAHGTAYSTHVAARPDHLVDLRLVDINLVLRSGVRLVGSEVERPAELPVAY